VPAHKIVGRGICHMLEHGRAVRRGLASTLAVDDDISRIYMGV
jgi:hypothetical protein